MPEHKLLGQNHEGHDVYLKPDGGRYYMKDGRPGASVSLNQADLTAATVFYIFKSWFTTDELEWLPDKVIFHGLKE